MSAPAVGLPEGWTRTTLEAVLIGPGELTYGIVQPGAHDPAGVPIVRVTDIRNGRVAVESPMRVGSAVDASFQRSKLQGGELLITLVGTVGECAVAPHLLRGWNTARAVGVARVRPDVGADWVALCLRSREVQERIAARVNTTVQTTLNLKDVRELPIVLPHPAELPRIRAFVTALDDKIESNRRLQQTAGELAAALVDRATRGATEVGYKDVMSVVMGSAFKGDAFSAPGTGRPLLRIRDLKTFASQTWTTEERADETLIRPGDIVVGMDAEFRATLWQGMPSLLNQRVCAFRPHDGVSRAFVLSALAPQLAFFEKAKSGTTVIHLNKADIDRFLIPRLGNDQHAKLVGQTEPLLDVVVNASAQSVRLAALRDALLPELLSGRIRVPEAGEAVEAALA